MGSARRAPARAPPLVGESSVAAVAAVVVVVAVVCYCFLKNIIVEHR